MKRLLFAAVLAALSTAALAADLPALKVPAPTKTGLMFDCSVNSYCVGPTLGFHLTGLNSNLDVLGSGLSGSFGAGGMAIGAEGGFQLWNGSYFAAVTVGADYDMAQNTDVLGGSPLNKVLFMEKAKFGLNLASYFGFGSAASAAPTPSAGGPLSGFNIPAALINSMTSMYLVAGAAQRSGLGSGTLTGAGVQFLLASHVTAEAEYNHIDWSKAVNFGTIPGQLKTEDRLMAGGTYHF